MFYMSLQELNEMIYEYRKNKHDQSVIRHNLIVQTIQKQSINTIDRKEPFKRLIRRMMV